MTRRAALGCVTSRASSCFFQHNVASRRLQQRALLLLLGVPRRQVTAAPNTRTRSMSTLIRPRPYCHQEKSLRDTLGWISVGSRRSIIYMRTMQATAPSLLETTMRPIVTNNFVHEFLSSLDSKHDARANVALPKLQRSRGTRAPLDPKKLPSWQCRQRYNWQWDIYPPFGRFSYPKFHLSDSGRSFSSSSATAQNDNDESFLTTTDQTSRLLRVYVMGPPNAGKSTLFNRLLDKRENQTYKLHADKRKRKRGRLSAASSAVVSGGALVSAIPGTTRDRRQAVGQLGHVRFLLMDTAGVDGLRLKSWYRRRGKSQDQDDADNDYERPMMEQAVMAAQSASVIFFLFDGRVGLTADDLETCRWLRRHVLTNEQDSPQRVVLVANKLEGTVLDDNELYQDFLNEASRAGFGSPIPISALQGDGMADLALVLVEMQQTLGLTDDDDDEEAENRIRPMQMAILGRPNVGKSTLVNALLQEHRVITGSRPGLTRDAIRIPWTWQNQPIQIVDTAGIRKASQRQDPHSTTVRKLSDPTLLEDMAVQDAIRALQVADVAVLVIDANERSLSRQDLAIANAILQEGRVLVVVANKMDLVIDEEDEEDPYTRNDLAKGVRLQLEERFPFLRKTPIVPLDSRSGKGVADDLMPVVMKAKERWERKISTGSLNRWLAEVVDGHAPPAIHGRATKLKYILQTKGRPPTFLLYTNQDTLTEPYVRYLTRQFQESFDMYGMQVRLAIKKSTSSDGGNPYAGKIKKKRSGFGLGGREARHARGVKNLIETGSRQHRRGKRNQKKE